MISSIYDLLLTLLFYENKVAAFRQSIYNIGRKLVNGSRLMINGKSKKRGILMDAS